MNLYLSVKFDIKTRILTKKGTYMSQYLCKHIGIQVNSSRARMLLYLPQEDFTLLRVSTILGYHFQASTQLRYQRFENCLDDEPRVGTLIHPSLL